MEPYLLFFVWRKISGRDIVMKKTIVVLAAGIGNRYGGLKQMDPVGPSGEFIIDYSIYDAIKAGFNRVVFIVSRGIKDDFHATIGARISDSIDVDYAYQELDSLPNGMMLPAERTKPWGTGHALLAARNVVKEPFAVINADDFYGREPYQVVSDFLSKDAGNASLYALIGFVLRNTLSEYGSVARGICDTDQDGKLTSVVEHTSIEKKDGIISASGRVCSGDEIVSMNMWGFKPLIFGQLENEFWLFLSEHINELGREFFLPSVVNDLAERGDVKVSVLRTNASWFGVTYREDRAMAVARIKALVDAGEYPDKLWG